MPTKDPLFGTKDPACGRSTVLGGSHPLKFSPRALLVLLVLIGLAFVSLRFAARSITPSVGYAVRAQFEELPNDDTKLSDWLLRQPGVVKAFVDRDDDAIRVYWITSQDLAGNPSAPDLRDHFEQFGYENMVSYNPDWNDR